MGIPEEYQQLCRDLAKVLREFNVKNGYYDPMSSRQNMVHAFTGQMQLSGEASAVNFAWENGRHGAGQGKITISAAINVRIKIDEEPKEIPDRPDAPVSEPSPV